MNQKIIQDIDSMKCDEIPRIRNRLQIQSNLEDDPTSNKEE